MIKYLFALMVTISFWGCSRDSDDPISVEIGFFKGQNLLFSFADIDKSNDSAKFIFCGYAEYKIDSMWTRPDTTWFQLKYYAVYNDNSIFVDTLIISKTKKYIQLQDYSNNSSSFMALMKSNLINLDTTKSPINSRYEFPIIPSILRVGDNFHVVRPRNETIGEVIREFHVKKEYNINGQKGVLVTGVHDFGLKLPFMAVYSQRGKEISTFEFGESISSDVNGNNIDTIFSVYCVKRLEYRPTNINAFISELKPQDFIILK